MQSILSRLEALEARRPDPIVVIVSMDDRTEQRLSVSEYAAIPDDVKPSGSKIRVTGGNLRELDVLLDAMIPGIF